MPPQDNRVGGIVGGSKDIMPLTQAQVKGLTEKGKHLDQRGLYLMVDGPDRRYWTFRYQFNKRERWMSFGSADVVTLGGARKLHDEARGLLAKRIDPLEARRGKEAPKFVHSFAAVAKACIDAHEAGWRNAVHRKQWRSSLATYAQPFIGAKSVDAIDVNDIVALLTPIWQDKAETASRVRGRIEAVLNYATARGWRSGPNPASWKGNLQLLLPAPHKLKRGGHHAAMGWAAVPEFMANLMAQESMGARALSFAILTAARSGEVRGATWDEIDMASATWTVPGSRMKSGRPHRVPLSDAALALLAGLAELRAGSLVFFSTIGNHVPLSDMTLLAVVKRMGLGGAVTTHGFRSTFRDWCADHGKPADQAEAALAHANGDKTQMAYLRSDLFPQRRLLMQQWADFLLGRETALAA
jgi:integrase